MRSTCGLFVFAALLVVGLCQAKDIGSAFKVVNANEDVNVDTVKMLAKSPSWLEGEWYTVALSGAARESSDRAKDLLPTELIELIRQCPCLGTNITRVMTPSGRLNPKAQHNRVVGVATTTTEERFHIVYFCQGKPQLASFRGLLSSVPDRAGMYKVKVERKTSSFEEGPEPTKEGSNEKEGKKVENEGEKVEPGKEKEEQEEKEKENPEQAKKEEEKAEKGKEKGKGKESEEKGIEHKEQAKNKETEIEGGDEEEEKVKKEIKKGISNFYILDFEEGEKGEKGKGGATPPRGLMLAALSSKDFVCIKSRSLPVTKAQLEPLMRYAKEHGFADLQLTGCHATNMPKNPARQ